MKYDFIEIGTSNFDTLIESAADTTIGLSIEPIKYYLDCLPERAGVKKLNCAVSRSNKNELLQVYYVPESAVTENNLPDWLRGCNAVGNYHPQHHRLNVEHLVVKQHVPCKPIGKILDENDVTELAYLKIDTEGSDADILLHLFEYLLTKSRSHYPKKILFETNELADSQKVEQVKKKYSDLGYAVSVSGYDTVLDLQD